MCGALTSVLTLPVVPVLPALLTLQAHAEAPLRADIGSADNSPPNPWQHFMTFQDSFHERVFGYPRDQQDDIVYHVPDPVTGPGLHLGHNANDDLFLFSVDLFEAMENPVDEVFPGVTATAISVVHGVAFGAEPVDVYALVTTMQFEGETQQRLLALSTPGTVRTGRSSARPAIRSSARPSRVRTARTVTATSASSTSSSYWPSGTTSTPPATSPAAVSASWSS